MKEYIEELEIRSNKDKGEYIKNFMKQRNIPFSTQPFKTMLTRGENIIVDYPFNKATPLRFIFFDLEDGWAIRGGSKAYVREFGIADVDKVYNLEGVGMGRVLLLWPSKSGSWLDPLAQGAENLGFFVIHLPIARIEI